MKITLFTLLLLVSSISFASQSNCLTEDSFTKSDLLFCNQELGYQITVKYKAEVKEEGQLTRSEESKYKEEAIRLTANQGYDDRFDYEPSFEEPGTVDFLYPQDGQFDIFRTTIDSKNFVYVYWNDIDDNSFSIVFESEGSYRPVYSLNEN